MEKTFTESQQIVAGIIPIDLSGQANNGDWVSLANYHHVAILVYKAAGASGEPPTITIKQAQDVSGTGAKALNFTRIDVKNGAQTGIGEFTKVTQAAANTYAPAAGDTQFLGVIEFDAEDLDVAGGFSCVQVSIADVGSTAQIGCAFYVLTLPRFAGQFPPSAIA